MTKQSINPTSLSVLLKQAEAIFSNPKASKQITLDDIQVLSSFIDKGNKFLVDKVSNLMPSINPNNKPNRTNYYNNNVARVNSSIASNQVRQQDAPLVISGDLQGTNFVTEASISLFDPTEEIEKQISQSIQEDESIGDEVEVLNSIFDTVEDVQQE